MEKMVVLLVAEKYNAIYNGILQAAAVQVLASYDDNSHSKIRKK